MRADKIKPGMQAEFHIWDGLYDTVRTVEIVQVFYTGRVLIRDSVKNTLGVVTADRLRSVGDHCPLPSERSGARCVCRDCLMPVAPGTLHNGKCAGCNADKRSAAGKSDMFSVNNRRVRRNEAA